jgi:hypothetical protein
MTYCVSYKGVFFMKTRIVFMGMAAVLALWGFIIVGCKVSAGDPHPTSGGETTIAVNETLAITAQGEGYTVQQWHLNGVVTEQSGDTFYFTSVTAGNYTGGKIS